MFSKLISYLDHTRPQLSAIWPFSYKIIADPELLW